MRKYIWLRVRACGLGVRGSGRGFLDLKGLLMLRDQGDPVCRIGSPNWGTCKLALYRIVLVT